MRDPKSAALYGLQPVLLWSIILRKAAVKAADIDKRFPDTYLTAPVWNWEHFYELGILECLQGKFQGVHHREGVETGLVDLAPFIGNENPESGRRRKRKGTVC